MSPASSKILINSFKMAVHYFEMTDAFFLKPFICTFKQTFPRLGECH